MVLGIKWNYFSNKIRILVKSVYNYSLFFYKFLKILLLLIFLDFMNRYEFKIYMID